MKSFFQLFMLVFFSNIAWSKGIDKNNPGDFAAIVDSCTLYLSVDSTNTGEFSITANPIGEAPFTFAWSTGETTQSIIPAQWGGVNYCVTITSASGCTATECLYGVSCYVGVNLGQNNTLYTSTSGVFPLSFIWNTGSTMQNIQPTTPGNYCVTMTDAVGCTSTDCYYYSTNFDSCGVYIVQDTANTGNYYTAIANGTPPFSYTWQPSGNTQSIPLDPAYFGDYCVTVTDATGCTAVNCAFGNNPCQVSILEEDSAGYNILIALGSSWGGTYTWNTGESAQYIVVNTSGTYCVTFAANGCTSTACYTYQEPNNFNISGYIYLPDSLNGPANLQGNVELFFNDQANNAWVSLGTTAIVTDASGWSSFYDFGTQTNAGEYLVLATLDPSMPIAPIYMPTYHFSTILWDEADPITLPSGGFGLYSIIMDDGQNLNAGTGSINGTVTEGDGLTANDEGNREGSPLANASVLLFDSNEQPITHTITDAEGLYRFNNLPFGTYKVMVEIVGKAHVERWVTLSAQNPSSNGNDFEVTENAIVLGLDELVTANSIVVSPNPTTAHLNLRLDAKTNFEATIQLTRLDGSTILIDNQSVTMGKQVINFDLSNIPSGIYLLQVTTEKGVVTAKVVKQ